MLNILLDCMMIAIPLTFFTGVYLLIKLRFFNLRYLKVAFKITLGKGNNSSGGLLSSFAALTSVLGGNLGVGNIAGIAVALSTGGPGAVFWMWVMAILGSIIKYTGCFVAIQCRIKQASGQFVGGPMYYMRDILKSPMLAILFCILTILSSFTVGNLAQVNSFAITLSHYEFIPPWLIGAVMAILVGLLFLGGMKAFSRVSSFLVPIMALSYLLCCLWILVVYFKQLPEAFFLIFTGAFAPQAAFGGVTGFTLIQTIQSGFNRGLFATDAGAGLESIIHSSVTSGSNDKKTAMSQALVSSLAPLIVALLCTFTALVLLCTNVWQGGALKSTQICIEAFQKGLHWNHAEWFVMVIIFCFALTTIMTWSFCCDKSFEYLLGRPSNIGKILFIICIPFGALVKVETVWLLGDIAFNGMLIINVIAVALLSKQVVSSTKELTASNKSIKQILLNEDPSH
ncbi:MAG: amino acid carrier protein [Silvanigrellaceae bacterium]|nr:amino acid carrier protein [Silvanigrellaceae bacterium]